MKLSDILLDQAEYTTNSGYSVEVDTNMPTVAIIDATGETVWFMQGCDAEQFVSEAGATWQKVGTLGMQTIFEAQAKDYIDSLD